MYFLMFKKKTNISVNEFLFLTSITLLDLICKRKNTCLMMELLATTFHSFNKYLCGAYFILDTVEGLELEQETKYCEQQSLL